MSARAHIYVPSIVFRKIYITSNLETAQWILFIVYRKFAAYFNGQGIVQIRSLKNRNRKVSRVNDKGLQ